MKRLLSSFLAALMILSPSFGMAASLKPLVNKSGVVQPIPSTDTLLISPSTTANAGINLSPGVDPTSPNNGDCWITSTVLKCRVNGVTVSYGASTPPGGTTGQIQYNNSGAFGGFTVSGDATVNTGTGALTLGTVNSNVGSFGDSTHIPSFTVNAKGLITAASQTSVTVPTAANPTATVSGSAVNGSASTFMRSDAAPALANTTVTPGSYGDASHVSTFTVDQQGRLTAAGSTVVSAAAGGSNGQIQYNSSGSLAGGNLSGAVTTSNSLVTTSTNPFPILDISVGVQSGAPSRTDLNAGAVMIDEAGTRLYQNTQPSASTPTVVQSQTCTSPSSWSCTLGTAPGTTNTHYLIAVCYTSLTNAGTPSANTGGGWVSINSGAGGGVHFQAAYRLVQTGDTTATTACTGGVGGGTAWGEGIWEVSNLSGTWSITFQTSNFNTAPFGPGTTSLATPTYTTTVGNTLALVSYGGANVGGSTTAAATASGWTDDGHIDSNQNLRIQEKTFVSTSAAAATGVWANGQSDGIVAFAMYLNPPASGVRWQPVSNLSTIKNAGTDIEINPLSLNCSTGTTCTTSSGAVTITASPGAGTVALSSLATQAANTVVANVTGSSTSPTAASLPSCVDTGGNHLNYTNGTGFSCGTSGGAGGVTQNNYYTNVGMVLLEEHSASSSASLAFTSWYSSLYTDYLIEFVNIVPATNATRIQMQVSTDGGATYDSSSSYVDSNWGWISAGSGTSGQAYASPTTVLNISSPSGGDTLSNSATTGGLSATYRMLNPGSSSTYKVFLGQGGGLTDSSAFVGFTKTAIYKSTSAVNAFKIFSSSGNITSGTIRIYGLGGSTTATVPNFGNMTVIQEIVTSGSASSATFSNIPTTYRDLRVVISGRGVRASQAYQDVGIRFNSDSGSNYSNHWVDFQATSATAPSFASSDNAMYVGFLTGSTSPANYASRIDVNISNYNDSVNYKVANAEMAMRYDTSSYFRRISGHAWRNTGAITSMTVGTFAGGNFADGVIITLYGIGGPSLGYPNFVGAMSAATAMSSFGGIGP